MTRERYHLVMDEKFRFYECLLAAKPTAREAYEAGYEIGYDQAVNELQGRMDELSEEADRLQEKIYKLKDEEEEYKRNSKTQKEIIAKALLKL